jgi:outer membrane lipoprotein carrier protein
MHKHSTVLCLLLITNLAFCQQDPAAREILDRVAGKTKSYKSIEANFELIVEDRKEKTQTLSSGLLRLKGDKYRIESMGSIVYFNGKTVWTYTEDIEEVVITEPDTADDSFLSNPAQIFYWYNRDFKYRYTGESVIDDRRMHEIDLYPKNLNQPFSSFKIFIDKEKEIITGIKIRGKDGIDYNIQIRDFVTDKELDDSIFTFDESKHKKAEIIDLRDY